jgi:hypothetical protein
LGDSITDGVGTTPDKDCAWRPARGGAFASRAFARRPSVLNLGLSGNRLLRHGFGVSALARFDRDVLSLAGVRWTIVPWDQRHHVSCGARYAAR